MSIPTETQPWDSCKRTAVINNYGAAGSNAAIVLHEWAIVDGNPVTANRPRNSRSLSEVPIFISAKTPESLQSYCAALKSYLLEAEGASADNMLENVAYNLATKQNRDLGYSQTFTSQDLSSLMHQLDTPAISGNDFNRSKGGKRPVVLCFGGQNGREVSLSKDLFDTCQIIQDHMVRLFLPVY